MSKEELKKGDKFVFSKSALLKEKEDGYGIPDIREVYVVARLILEPMTMAESMYYHKLGNPGALGRAKGYFRGQIVRVEL